MKNLNAVMRQLFIDNRFNGDGYRIDADDTDSATIYVYDAISAWGGVDPEDFARDLATVTANTIHLRINSPGGDVFDARAMITAVRQHSARVVAHIDGIAASAATGLALAADEVEISSGGFFMIHNAWSIGVGDAGEMRALADVLDKVNDSLVSDYTRKTQNSDEQIREWMNAETWFSAEEAIEHGFVDRMADEHAPENSVRWNLSAYNNTPNSLTVPPKIYDRAGMERRLALLTKVAA